MMMMMMMMICFCGVVDQRKAFSLISSRIHCQRSSTSRFSDTPRAGFEPVQKPISGLIKWSCAVVIIHYTSASKYFPFLFAWFALSQKYTELLETSFHDLVYTNIAQAFVLGRVLVWQLPHKKMAAMGVIQFTSLTNKTYPLSKCWFNKIVIFYFSLHKDLVLCLFLQWCLYQHVTKLSHLIF